MNQEVGGAAEISEVGSGAGARQARLGLASGAAGRASGVGAGSGTEPGPIGVRRAPGASSMSPQEPAPVTGGVGIPGWGLRLLLAACAAVVCVVVSSDGAGPLVTWGLVISAALTAGLPASASPAVLIVVAVVGVTSNGGDPLRPEVLSLMPLLHLTHLLAAVTAVLPWRSRVRAAALRPALLRVVVVQLVAAGLVLVVWTLPSTVLPAWLEVAGLVSAAGLAVVGVLALRRSPNLPRDMPSERNHS
ncbi:MULTISPECIES: hypothetical protein [Actinoalloteichus]|uniref:Uncharacterized protein n=1 Tax=Actinoalloteichus fjordicus TaxID=1612552 RepID=A0AAC9LAM3_9PSEU|nr:MULTISPECIES: hypothetical protein [Actinoalloteichus]APU12839.1 hypothetical protein UA74_03795 [Actinoalloteichus fjordicus]APU18811.1 hypothetical protein UA75_03895 [Actinoalloteichus sp. GBA129-24]